MKNLFTKKDSDFNSLSEYTSNVAAWLHAQFNNDTVPHVFDYKTPGVNATETPVWATC